MKTCTKCNETKPLDEFHREARHSDGRRADCRVCNSARVVARYHENPEVKARVMDAANQRNLGNPPEYRARKTLQNADYRGKITKPDTCSKCGAGGMIHGHHEDYAKPLDVIWLCPPCHGRIHSEERA